jgi:hypothetical protein
LIRIINDSVKVIWAPGKCIRANKLSTRDMVNLKVVLSHGKMPTGLSRGQMLRGAEVPKVIMISKNDYRVVGARKEMSPCFEGMENCEQFSVVDLVISFGGIKRLGKVTAGMVFPIPISL